MAGFLIFIHIQHISAVTLHSKIMVKQYFQSLHALIRKRGGLGLGILGKFGVWSLEFGVWNVEFGMWSLEFGVKPLASLLKLCGTWISWSFWTNVFAVSICPFPDLIMITVHRSPLPRSLSVSRRAAHRSPITDYRLPLHHGSHIKKRTPAKPLQQPSVPQTVHRSPLPRSLSVSRRAAYRLPLTTYPIHYLYL